MVCVCLVGFIPSTHAQNKKAEKGANGPISKDELIAHFQVKRVVDGYVIKGNDIIEIIRDTDLDITIKNSIIEGGLNFGTLPKTPVENVRLPAIWSDNEKTKWIEVRRAFCIQEIPIVVNKIIITDTEILPVQQSNQSADSVAIDLRAALFLSVDFQRSAFRGKAIFDDATFSKRASFSSATFSGEAFFTGATFSGVAVFDDATFSKRASFSDATFSEGASFDDAIFSGEAFFDNAIFSGEASFSDATLKRANFAGTSLREANFSFADLSEATFTKTDLKDAILAGVNLTGAQYEPISAPAKGSLGGIIGLKDVRFDEEQQSGLVLLRATLKEAGLRELEREATYAIKHTETLHLWRHGSLRSRIGAIFEFIFFDLTTAWGMAPGRPLLILAGLLSLCAVIYIFPIWGGGNAGIVQIWPKERMEMRKKKVKKAGKDRFEVKQAGKDRLERLSAQGSAALGYAFYFSLLSAFHIGWRDLNIGSWITRIQSRQYTLRAMGWVRMVSGLQSIISVYLIALWALTYFGRPFE